MVGPDWGILEQAFADVSEVAIRVAIGSGSLIYLSDKNGRPRYVFAAQVAEHFPGLYLR